MSTPLIILDFDGTICLGDAPVEAYAREVEARLPDAAARRVRDAFARYQAGLSDEADGYFAIARAFGDGLAPEQASAAYLASRNWLAQHPDSVAVPDGIVEFLARVGDRGTRRVLFTNSPTHGVEQVLAAHGLADSVDEVIGDARKPGSWPARLTHWLSDREPGNLLSIGDVWANDCLPVLAAGAAAAFIDAGNLRSGPATMTGRSFPAIYDDVLAWTADPAAFGAAHPVRLPDSPGASLR